MNPDPASLDRLHDIVAPPPAPWWPPAPGWLWVLAALGVVALVLLARLLHEWARNCYRREALEELEVLEQRLDGPALVEIAALLKRCALSSCPRSEVASLTGDRWIEFLDRSAGAPIFGARLGRQLAAVAYGAPGAGSPDEAEARDIAAAARRWIRQHRVDPGATEPGAL